MYRAVAPEPRRLPRGGTVVGVDSAAEQLAKARGLAACCGSGGGEFRCGRIERVPANDKSRFISQRARDASAKYGVESVSLLARKE